MNPPDHGSRLTAAITITDTVNLAEVKRHLAAGHPLLNAAAIFATSLWNPRETGTVHDLMQRYHDAGYFGVHDKAVVNIHSANPLYRHQTPLLCLAILSGYAAPAAFLLEHGALEGPGIAAEMVQALRTSHGDSPEHYQDLSAEEMLEVMVKRMFSSSQASVWERVRGALARRVEAQMRDRIDGSGLGDSAVVSRLRARAVCDSARLPQARVHRAV